MQSKDQNFYVYSKGMCPARFFIITFVLIGFLLLYVYAAGVYQNREPFFECKVQDDNKPEYIIPQEQLAIIQGNNLPTEPPITPVAQFDNDPSAPTIDGDPSSPSQMFIFAYNKVSPDCCPSPYSNSQGCVCITDGQLGFIAQRGNNSRFAKCSG